MSIEVYTPRWAQFLSKLFSGRGGRGGSPLIVLDDVLPVVSLVDPGEFEAHWLRQEFPFAAPLAGLANVGLYTVYQVVNPVNSGYLLMIETVILSGLSVAANTFFGVGPIIAGGLAPLSSTDLRVTNAPQMGANTSAPGAPPTFTNVLGNLYLPALTGPTRLMEPPEGIVIPPGSSFILYPAVVNVSYYITVSGYVRYAEPGELA
jgi:hypothetical protein